LEPNFLSPGTLDLSQRLVEHIAGIRQTQQLAAADQRPSDNRQDVVAAVAAQNPIRLDAQHLGRTPPKGIAQRIGIPHQTGFGRLLDGPRDARRRRIRALVRVQLDEFPRLRLFARRVTDQSFDLGTEIAHG
jgi:hypothetical protein